MTFYPNNPSMPIQTDRLVLRPIQVEDAPIIFDAVVESWAELSKWQIWALNTRVKLSVSDYEDFCRKKHGLYSDHKDITLLAFDKASQKLVGSCALQQPNWEDRSFYLGYWLRTSETGKGYATEIARDLSRYAFEELKAQTIKSFHKAGNTASKAVLLRAGFQSAATPPDKYPSINNDLHYHLTYAPL